MAFIEEQLCQCKVCWTTIKRTSCNFSPQQTVRVSACARLHWHSARCTTLTYVTWLRNAGSCSHASSLCKYSVQQSNTQSMYAVCATATLESQTVPHLHSGWHLQYRIRRMVWSKTGSILTRLQCWVKMKAFHFEALLGSLHCLFSQLQRPLQALTALYVIENIFTNNIFIIMLSEYCFVLKA